MQLSQPSSPSPPPQLSPKQLVTQLYTVKGNPQKIMKKLEESFTKFLSDAHTEFLPQKSSEPKWYPSMVPSNQLLHQFNSLEYLEPKTKNESKMPGEYSDSPECLNIVKFQLEKQGEVNNKFKKAYEEQHGYLCTSKNQQPYSFEEQRPWGGMIKHEEWGLLNVPRPVDTIQTLQKTLKQNEMRATAESTKQPESNLRQKLQSLRAKRLAF